MSPPPSRMSPISPRQTTARPVTGDGRRECGRQTKAGRDLRERKVTASRLRDLLVGRQAAAIDWVSGGFVPEASWQQQERTQRRYLAAVRPLAQVRRLLVQAVQVN